MIGSIFLQSKKMLIKRREFYCFSSTLNDERCKTKILEQFFEQLDDINSQNFYFQQDGATAH